MATKKKMLQAAAGAAGGGLEIAIEEVFSTYLYTGNSSTQTITNGIDLAGEGGLVWIKGRNEDTNNTVVDTIRGGTNYIQTNSNSASASANVITAFNSDGFTLGTGFEADWNQASPLTTYASWTFRKAPRFFDVVTYTGTGSAQAIAHNLGVEPGCIIVKRLDSAVGWPTYHRSNGNTGLMYLNTTAAVATPASAWGSTNPTDTHFTVGSNVSNISGGSFVAYLFAHNAGGFGDAGTDNVISCGSFTTNGSGAATVNLGYEAQWVMMKRSDGVEGWWMTDNMRGNSLTSYAYMYANASDAEAAGSGTYVMAPTATGFLANNLNVSATYIYIAIRRGPMRAPTDGTEVFDTFGGNLSNGTPVTTGFPVDMQIGAYRSFVEPKQIVDRLRGIDTGTGAVAKVLYTNTSDAEINDGFATNEWGNTGYKMPNNFGYQSTAFWSFRRAPGFFDVVAYTGNSVAGRTIPHNLGVAPEMMLVVKRTGGVNRPVYHTGLNGGTNPEQYGITINTTDAEFSYATGWNNTAPSDTSFTLGTHTAVNDAGNPYLAYLFATLAGVSKVGSYTGNGTSQTINCGFTSGARFVLIRRTDSTGDWYIWDSARGIVAGNDPHLSLNTDALEVTTDDSVDAESSGFIVNQDAATNVNVNTASYIFLAIA